MDLDEQSLNSAPTVADGARRPSELYDEPSLGSAPTMVGVGGFNGRASSPGNLQDFPAPIIGQIDQYVLLCKLGEGGFGVVYKARDTTSGLEVALKTLHPLLKANPDEMANLQKRFALVSRLSHPNIVTALVLHPVRDIAIANDDISRELHLSPGDSVMVMRFAPGETLSKWRKQFPKGIVPLGLVLEIGRQVASALDYAHSEKVLHRDVSPRNIMVETIGEDDLASLPYESLSAQIPPKIRARVLDFGLASELSSSLSRVSVGGTSGTNPYKAPEVWRGRRQDARTDQYSFACVIYELLSGVPPFANVFQSGDPTIMRAAVENDDPFAVENVPDCVNEAFAVALAKSRHDRFSSCTEFVTALSGNFAKYPHPVRLLRMPASSVPQGLAQQPLPAKPSVENVEFETSVIAKRIGLVDIVKKLRNSIRSDAELGGYLRQAETELAVADEAVKLGRFAAADLALSKAKKAVDSIADIQVERRRRLQEAKERKVVERAALQKAAQEEKERKKEAAAAARLAAEAERKARRKEAARKAEEEKRVRLAEKSRLRAEKEERARVLAEKRAMAIAARRARRKEAIRRVRNRFAAALPRMKIVAVVLSVFVIAGFLGEAAVRESKAVMARRAAERQVREEERERLVREERERLTRKETEYILRELDTISKGVDALILDLEKAGVGRYAPDWLNEANAVRSEAASLRGNGDYYGAKVKYEEALRLAKEALSKAISEQAAVAAKTEAELAKARTAIEGGDWSGVIAAANCVFELDSGNAEAASLKLQAEAKIEAAEKARREAHDNVIKAIGEADAAKIREDWETVLAKANESLTLDADNAEAKRLKNEAEAKLAATRTEKERLAREEAERKETAEAKARIEAEAKTEAERKAREEMVEARLVEEGHRRVKEGENSKAREEAVQREVESKAKNTATTMDSLPKIKRIAVPAATLVAMERGGAGATQQDQIKANAATQAISEQARVERRAKIDYERPENIHFSFKPPATTRRVGHPGDRGIKLTDEQIGKLNEIGEALAAQNRVAADARVEAQRDEKKLEASNEASRREFWDLFREEMRMSAADGPGAALSEAEKGEAAAVAAEKEARDKADAATEALAAAKAVAAAADKARDAARDAVRAAQGEMAAVEKKSAGIAEEVSKAAKALAAAQAAAEGAEDAEKAAAAVQGATARKAEADKAAAKHEEILASVREKKGEAETAFAEAEAAANAAKGALAKAHGDKAAADDALKGAREDVAKAKGAVAVAGKGVSGARAETDRAVDVLIAAFDEQVAETRRRKLAAIGWQLMDATEQESQLAREARRKYFAARKAYAAARKALDAQRRRYENREIQWDTAEYANARGDYFEKRTAFEEAEDTYNKYFSDSHTFHTAALTDAEADRRYETEEALRALHGVQFRGDRRWLARTSVNGEPLLDSFLGEMEWQADQVGERDPEDPSKVSLTPEQAAECARIAAATVQRRAVYGGFYFAGLEVELKDGVPVCFVDKGRYGPITIVFVDKDGKSLDTGRIYNETNILAKLGSKAGDTNALDAVREGEAFNFIELVRRFKDLNASSYIKKASVQFQPLPQNCGYGYDTEDVSMGAIRTIRAICLSVVVQEKGLFESKEVVDWRSSWRRIRQNADVFEEDWNPPVAVTGESPLAFKIRCPVNP